MQGSGARETKRWRARARELRARGPKAKGSKECGPEPRKPAELPAEVEPLVEAEAPTEAEASAEAEAPVEVEVAARSALYEKRREGLQYPQLTQTSDRRHKR